MLTFSLMLCLLGLLIHLARSNDATLQPLYIQNNNSSCQEILHWHQPIDKFVCATIFSDSRFICIYPPILQSALLLPIKHDIHCSLPVVIIVMVKKYFYVTTVKNVAIIMANSIDNNPSDITNVNTRYAVSVQDSSSLTSLQKMVH